jgi:hypothetical protein
MEGNFENYYKASRFILDKTRRKVTIFDSITIRFPFKILNISNMHYMKQTLISGYSESELRTLKALVNSEMESKKNFGPNNILITIFITGVFTFLISFFISYINFAGQLYTMFIKGEIKDAIILEMIKKDLDSSLSSSQFNEFLTKLFIDNMAGYYEFFFTAFGCILVYLIWYKWSYKRLVKLDNIVNQAIEEKKVENNQ